ncbi:hypothetical protein [Mycoplasma phocimorsus]|uniref:hypothetical protein n=1 Tax=Mycoplasma phocimorsus TaxID=3045839 RepID=UPI0024BFA0FC|nr:hypothetical protein [Mycoplasma phocimorsus]MDJ1646451.1 hypothetical protein [Mycoplasma phocimorsus]MDJ1648861.1 hypothetical protein [Mycoplasma phocimorsus]
MKNKKVKNFINILTVSLISFVPLCSLLLSINYQNNSAIKTKQQNIKNIKTNNLINKNIYVENSLLQNSQPEINLQISQGHVFHKFDTLLQIVNIKKKTIANKIDGSLLSNLFGFFSNNSTLFLSALYSAVGLAALSGLGYSVYKSIKDENDRKDAAKELEEDLNAGITYTFKFKPYDGNKTGGKWKVYKYFESDKANLNQNLEIKELTSLSDDKNDTFFEFEYKANGKNENNKLIILFEKDEKIKREQGKEEPVFDGYSLDVYLWNFYNKKNKNSIDLYERFEKGKKVGTLVLKEKEKTNKNNGISIKIPSR